LISSPKLSNHSGSGKAQCSCTYEGYMTTVELRELIVDLRRGEGLQWSIELERVLFMMLTRLENLEDLLGETYDG